MLRVEGVAVSFGGVQALGGVSLSAEAGAVTGLIGPNGAGKTTLFNVVTGFQRPTRGEVWIDGRNVTSVFGLKSLLAWPPGTGRVPMKPHTRSRLGLGRTFQRLELFGSLSARENLLVAVEARRGRGGHQSQSRAADEIIERVGLQSVAGRQADTLGTGMARLVELGRALATRPKLLLLDEPSSGLDQAETHALGQLLAGLAAEGMAVLLVEHDVDLVMRVCNRVHVLDFGRMIADGSPAQVQADPRVQLAYLGAEAGEAPAKGSGAGVGG